MSEWIPVLCCVSEFSVTLHCWLCGSVHLTGDETKNKRGVLTAETPEPSSLPGYHIKKLQGRKVILSGWESNQGMWSHKLHKQRGKHQERRKAEHRETSPWFSAGWMSVHPVQVWCRGSSSHIRKVFLAVSVSVSHPRSLSFFPSRGCLGFGTRLNFPLPDWDSIRQWHGVKSIVFLLLYCHTLCHTIFVKTLLLNPVNLLFPLKAKRKRGEKKLAGACCVLATVLWSFQVSCHLLFH